MNEEELKKLMNNGSQLGEDEIFSQLTGILDTSNNNSQKGVEESTEVTAGTENPENSSQKEVSNETVKKVLKGIKVNRLGSKKIKIDSSHKNAFLKSFFKSFQKRGMGKIETHCKQIEEIFEKMLKNHMDKSHIKNIQEEIHLVNKLIDKTKEEDLNPDEKKFISEQNEKLQNYLDIANIIELIFNEDFEKAGQLIIQLQAGKEKTQLIELLEGEAKKKYEKSAIEDAKKEGKGQDETLNEQNDSDIAPLSDEVDEEEKNNLAHYAENVKTADDVNNTFKSIRRSEIKASNGILRELIFKRNTAIQFAEEIINQNRPIEAQREILMIVKKIEEKFKRTEYWKPAFQSVFDDLAAKVEQNEKQAESAFKTRESIEKNIQIVEVTKNKMDLEKVRDQINQFMNNPLVFPNKEDAQKLLNRLEIVMEKEKADNAYTSKLYDDLGEIIKDKIKLEEAFELLMANNLVVDELRTKLEELNGKIALYEVKIAIPLYRKIEEKCGELKQYIQNNDISLLKERINDLYGDLTGLENQLDEAKETYKNELEKAQKYGISEPSDTHVKLLEEQFETLNKVLQTYTGYIEFQKTMTDVLDEYDSTSVNYERKNDEDNMLKPVLITQLPVEDSPPSGVYLEPSPVVSSPAEKPIENLAFEHLFQRIKGLLDKSVLKEVSIEELEEDISFVRQLFELNKWLFNETRKNWLSEKINQVEENIEENRRTRSVRL